ncbi:MAG: hypothetical protein KIS66_03545 [Fimbriimonadaceae bacterium]|nr:hypothetical protein [Fimbriimonadaceae bacterium]
MPCLILACLAVPVEQDDAVDRALGAVNRIVARALADPGALPNQVAWRNRTSGTFRVRDDVISLHFGPGSATYIDELDLVGDLFLPVIRPPGFDRETAERLKVDDARRIATAIIGEKARPPFSVRAHDIEARNDDDTYRFYFTLWRSGRPVFQFGPVSSVHIDVFSGFPVGVSNIVGYMPEARPGRSHRVSEAAADAEAWRVCATMPPLPAPRLIERRFGWAIPHFANDLNEMDDEHRAASANRQLVLVYVVTLGGYDPDEGSITRFVVVDAHTGRGLAVRELRMGHQLGGPLPPAPPPVPTLGPARLARPSGGVTVTLRPSDAPFPSDGAAAATLVVGDAIFTAKVAKDGRLIQVGERTNAVAKPLTSRDLAAFAPRPFGKPRT